MTSKTTINLLLEVFSEHGLPLTIRCDQGHNFISSQFIEFCKQLNIAVTLSSGYHHSSNPAECAVKTVKSLLKRCLEANTSWCIALIEYLSTLGANILSPSQLMGRQFRGLLPFFQDHSASKSIKEQVLLIKEAEKQRFDKMMAHDLPIIPVSATVSYMNKDQKTWSVR